MEYKVHVKFTSDAFISIEAESPEEAEAALQRMFVEGDMFTEDILASGDSTVEIIDSTPVIED